MPKRGDTQEKQEVDRVRCLQMLKDGKTPSKIMKALRRSKKFVFGTIKYRQNTYKCKTKRRAGRPKKLTIEAKKIIRKSREKRNGSTRKLANEN
jgi:hypothetical protein